MILHAVVVPCDYHVTFREEYFSLQNLFAKTLSIAKVLKISKGRRGKGGEEKGGKKRKSGEEGGEGRRKGTELRKMQVVTYDCHGDIV